MTEVASLLLPNDHRLTSVRHYEAGPPAGLVEPGETFATTKEEEWVSKKTTEVLNTKQIETRVKRQVVLEDGKIVEDTGPMVTTNTTEDSETQEHHQTELRKLGDDDAEGLKRLEGGDLNDEVDGKGKWVAVPNPDGVVREVKERRVVSREETEELKETEDIQHYGDITDEDFVAAVNSGKSDLRQVLRTRDGGRTVVSTGPRLIHESSKSNKVTDTEDTRELSSVLPNGKIVTETQRTTEHEEINDDELPEGAPEQDYQKESSQRFLKTREQEDVDYLAGGAHVGHEMRYKTETMEVEKRGTGFDEADFDSLSARVRKRTGNIGAGSRQIPRGYRGVENGGLNVLHRNDAVTRKPLDFDQEEETRKVETSKWLEHHFGSDSRSNSTLDEHEFDQPQPPKTSFFNVTIKSQPLASTAPDNANLKRVYSPSNLEPERERLVGSSGYYKGISEWSERQHKEHHQYSSDRPSPVPYRVTSPTYDVSERKSPYQRPSYSPDYRNEYRSPSPTDFRSYNTKVRPSYSPTPNYHHRQAPSPLPEKRSPSPVREYRFSPKREPLASTPTPPQRKRIEKVRQQRIEEKRYDSYRRHDRNDEVPQREEPPPDYSPPSPPPMPEKVRYETRRKSESPQTKAKSGNIIGQSIRKLVGKIRSASAERKARQRAKRSPSPSYQKGHEIDNIDRMERHASSSTSTPKQRYYLGEDPFGSIYGRENKYDGVKPARSSRRGNNEPRSQGTSLGRFSKSTSRLVSNSNHSIEEEHHPRRNISSQTLPRQLHTNSNKSYKESPVKLEKTDSTINVSIINTVSSPQPPAKPARSYLARSKSFNLNLDDGDRNPEMYKSNPQLNAPAGLKSPGLISSLNRSHKDVSEEYYTTNRFASRNGSSDDYNNKVDNKRVFLSNLKDKAPELFRTLESDDADFKTDNYKSTFTSSYSNTRRGSGTYGGDVYEPPTRLRDTTSTFNSTLAPLSPQNVVHRRGSNSSTDFSETYHTTKRNDDNSVTSTVKTISKKTIPARSGRGMETIESSETKSVTKSHYRTSSGSNNPSPIPGQTPVRYYETERRYASSGSSPVVIEVRNNYRK